MVGSEAKNTAKSAVVCLEYIALGISLLLIHNDRSFTFRDLSFLHPAAPSHLRQHAYLVGAGLDGKMSW